MPTALSVLAKTSPAFQILAGETLAAGDLVSLREEGRAFKVRPTVGLAMENNNTAGTVQLGSTQSTASSSAYLVSNTVAACILTNGNGVLAYSKASVYYPQIIMVTGGGNLMSAPVMIATGSICYGLRLLAQSNGGFVVAWTTNGGTFAAVHNSSGVIQGSVITVNAGGGTSVPNLDICELANGDFVIVYVNITSTVLRFSRFNSSGVLQGSDTLISTGDSPYQTEVHSLTDGGFFVYWFKDAGTPVFRYARFSSSGLLQGSVIQLSETSSSKISYPIGKFACELSNGSKALIWNNPSDSNCLSVKIYDSADNAVATVRITTGSAAAAIVPLVSGGFVTLNSSGGSCYMMVFDNSGGIILNNTQVDTSMIATGALDAYEIPGVGLVFWGNSQVSNYAVRVKTVNYQGAAVGTPINIEASAATSLYYGPGAYRSGVMLVPWLHTTNSLAKLATIQVERSSVFGVVSVGAPVGALATVKTEGTFTINQNIMAGGSFNSRANAVPGNRGTIAGNTASLFGTDSVRS